MSEYNWVPLFKAIANWIADYEERQPELVQILRDIGVDNGLEDELSDGSKVPLDVIDPFTFFATFMKYGVKKRSELFAELSKRLELSPTLIVPSEFLGVPSAQPLKVWLFPYAKERTQDMVPNLWTLFRQMRSRNIDGELFNEILRIPHTGFAKLTECLFYLSPNYHFPVDAQTKPWLKAKGRSIPEENWVSYQNLLNWLDENIKKPYYEISHLAWLDNKQNMFSAAKADEYLSDRYEGTRSGTIHIVAFKTSTKRELAFDQGSNPDSKRKIKLFIDAHPPSNISPVVESYVAGESRNNHLVAHAPTLSQKYPAWVIEISSLNQLETFCDWYDGEKVKEKHTMKKETESKQEKKSLNQILYGPPGTGKTYSTSQHAVSLADPDWFFDVKEQGLSVNEEREKIKARYEELTIDGRIAFTTFHQSFSYEDFIEGIRASSNDNGELVYDIEDGIFKLIAERAGRAVVGTKPFELSESPSVWKISIGPKSEKTMRDICINDGEARIGWSRAGDLSLDFDEREPEKQVYWETLSARNHAVLNDFSENVQIGDVLLCLKDAETVQAVGIVTSEYTFDDSTEIADGGYAHVRKVNWVLKNIDLNILSLNNNRRMVQQTLYRLPRISWNSLTAELQKQSYGMPSFPGNTDTDRSRPNYVLIIDEINRGNISRIFGELITVLEQDKRIGGQDERSVILPYSKEPFRVPDNLYVLGTMNTADKSLAQLDIALRRRFDFIELMPNPKLLSDIVVHGVEISKLLEVLNQRIEVLLDRDHMLGHAYFWSLKEAKTVADKEIELAGIFENQIIPLLQEYFFSDWERIGWVLNDHAKEFSSRFIQMGNLGMPLTSLFPDSIASELSDRRYKINQSAFANPDSYQGILPKARVTA